MSFINIGICIVIYVWFTGALNLWGYYSIRTVDVNRILA